MELVLRQYSHSVWQVGDKLVMKAHVTTEFDMTRLEIRGHGKLSAHSGEIFVLEPAGRPVRPMTRRVTLEIVDGHSRINCCMPLMPQTMATGMAGRMFSEVMEHSCLPGVDGRIRDAYFADLSEDRLAKLHSQGMMNFTIRFEHALTGLPC